MQLLCYCGVYVTAYARMELYNVLEKLRKDFCILIQTAACTFTILYVSLWNHPIINSRLGKWTDEEPDCKITHFKGLGL